MRDYFHEIFGPNPWGDQDDQDEGGKHVVPDGGRVSVHPMTMDHQPGHLPRSAGDAERSVEAWAKRRAELQDAWRKATPLPRHRPRAAAAAAPTASTRAVTDDGSDPRAASEARYQRRCQKLESAWRSGR